METELISITITEEMVEDFFTVFGKQKRLPPTFPMIFYRFIPVPWSFKAAPIHRKQKCTCPDELSVGKSYRCIAFLEEEYQKGNYTFYTQTLKGYDSDGRECFRCVSELVVRT